MYQGVRNVSSSDNFAYVLNGCYVKLIFRNASTFRYDEELASQDLYHEKLPGKSKASTRATKEHKFRATWK